MLGPAPEPSVNQLFFGDNLDVLRESIKDESMAAETPTLFQHED